MYAVIFNIVLAALCSAQAPLPPLPDVPLPPLPAQPAALDLKEPVVAPKQDSPASLPPMAAQPPIFELKEPVVGPTKDPATPLQPPGFKELTPIPPGSTQVTPGTQSKPLPFRLLESVPTTDTTSLKPAPMPLADSFSHGLATPYLVLTRNGPSSIKAGQTFAYEIIVRNAGVAVAVQARLEDELPPGTRVVRAVPSPISVGERMAWIIENLPPGAERHFQVEVETDHGGEWKANATLTVAVNSLAKASVTGAVPRPLSVLGPASAPAGHPVKFNLRVTNTTDRPLTQAMLRVQLSPGLQHYHGEAIEAPVADLAPGQTREVGLDLIALQTGRLTGDITLVSAGRPMTGVQLELVATEQPILSIRQTGPLAPPLGGEHDYRLEIANRGDAEVRDVQLADMLPEGLQLVSAFGAQYEQAARTIQWNIGTLAPGEAKYVVFRAQVRGVGPQVNRITARATGVADAHLHTVVRVTNR